MTQVLLVIQSLIIGGGALSDNVTTGDLPNHSLENNFRTGDFLLPFNRVPVAENEFESVAIVSEQRNFQFNIGANDSDPDNDELTTSGVTNPEKGTVTYINNIGGPDAIIYTPFITAEGTDSFTYQVVDPGGLRDTATINLSITNFLGTPEQEGNNRRQDANTATNNETFIGQLSDASDQDYFIINTVRGSLTVSLDPISDDDTNDNYKLSVFDDSQTPNLLAQRSGGSDFVLATGINAGGSNLILVEKGSHFSGDGYLLNIRNLVNDLRFETEGNDNRSAPNQLSNGGSVSGQLSTSGDVDYYRINATAGTLTVRFESPVADTSTDFFTISVLNAGGSVLSQYRTGQDLVQVTGIDVAGNYLIAIEDSGGYDDGQYRLQVTNSTLQGTHETENNDQRGSRSGIFVANNIADPLSENRPIKGQLSSNNDADFYSISINQATTLTIDFDAPTDSNSTDFYTITVLDAAITAKTFARVATGTDVSFSTAVETAGNYFISIEDGNGFSRNPPGSWDDGEYSLTVSTSNTDAESENNDNRFLADTILMARPVVGQLSSTNDADYFKIDISPGSVDIDFDVPINSRITPSSEPFSYTISLLSTDGGLLARESTGRDLDFSTSVLGSGTHYIAIEDSGGFDDGQYTLTVSANSNVVPIANNDTATVAAGQRTTINIGANDSDANNDELTTTGLTSPSKGTVSYNNNTGSADTVTYTGFANATGTDSFTYQVSDGKGGTDNATVTVTFQN
ncbi:Ig-like domain-containing protein, partial [Alphaproteobacteria bacterium]|nr:Ig-like domain-containing protein [Alphaproteobacteria bacterium]